MSKAWKGALVSFILMVICWFGLNVDNFEMIRFVTTIYSAILFVGFLFTGTVKTIKNSISPYCVFAIVNTVIGIGTAIYSIFDIKNDTDEWFGGLVGTILLVFVIPFVAVLLIIDFIAWKKSNKTKTANSVMKCPFVNSKT